MKKQLPNIFTLLNLVCGCIAITYILQNGITIQYTADNAQFIDIPEKIWMASFFIALAAVIDFLDGFVARLFNATSEMGKQLDSLADVVSFGAAPAMILYQFLRLGFAAKEDGIDISMIWLMPVFIYAAAAAYRLARFNLDTSGYDGFRGVPVPAAGLTLASFPLIYHHSENDMLSGLLVNPYFIYAVVIVMSVLMVSNLPLIALKFKDLSVKNNLPKYILIVFSAVAAILLHWLAVPVIFIAYIILSLVFQKKIV